MKRKNLIVFWPLPPAATTQAQQPKVQHPLKAPLLKKHRKTRLPPYPKQAPLLRKPKQNLLI